jgi:hypothetical protein
LKFLKIFRVPPPEVIHLLQNNIIGTPGHGMLYQHLRVIEKISRIADPQYVTLVRNENIVGTCCFCSRVPSNVHTKIKSFYVRYFSFKDLFRRKHISKRSGSGHSLLREEIKTVLGGVALGVAQDEKFFHYAYVDPRNQRSALLCAEFGFEKVRQYATIIFNRFNPQQVIEVEQTLESHEQQVRGLLKNFYSGYTMFSEENLFSEKKYYVIKEGDRIIAGVQATPDSWKIHSLPGTGISGKLKLNIFSITPYLNRLINKNYEFLTLEGIFCVAGYEHCLEKLFESLLARYRLHSAIMVVDAASPLYKIIKSLKLGWLDKLNKEVRGNVICQFHNLSENERKMFITNPCYISGIDVT